MAKISLQSRFIIVKKDCTTALRFSKFLHASAPYSCFVYDMIGCYSPLHKRLDHIKKYQNFPIVLGWKFKGNGQVSMEI